MRKRAKISLWKFSWARHGSCVHCFWSYAIGQKLVWQTDNGSENISLRIFECYFVKKEKKKGFSDIIKDLEMRELL